MIVTSLFLGTNWISFTHLLFEIGKIIPTSNNLLISFFAISISKGLSHLWGCLIGLASYSIKMWYMHVEGLMPLMLTRVQLIACLWSPKTGSIFSSCSNCKLFAMMTSNFSFSARKAYLDGLKGVWAPILVVAQRKEMF